MKHPTRRGGPAPTNSLAHGRRAVRAARAEGPSKTGALYLYGPVSAYSFWSDRVVSARGVIEALKELEDCSHVDVHLHSPGGDALEGVAIRSLLVNHPATITVWVDGLAASAASYVALAGDEVVMCAGAQMMIHDASLYTYGNAAELRDDADFLDKQSDNIASLYARRAGGTAASWRGLMTAETWYSDEEAVAAGLADRVADTGSAGAPDETEVADSGEDSTDAEMWDLSAFTYPGRAAAPTPAALARDHKPPTASAGGSTTSTTEGGTAVAFTDEQLTTMRKQLGIPEDADEATILAALTEVLEEQAPAASADIPDGMVVIESAVLTQLRADSAAGREALNRQRTEDRDRAIDAAIADGRTTPGRREHWVTQWNADPEGARQMLDALAPGLVPLTELGDDQPDGTVTDIRETDEFKNWSM